jgi:glutaredoxin-related protein
MTLLQSLSYVDKNKIKYVDILDHNNRYLLEQFKMNDWTVPQIFIGNLYIQGGNDKLKELHATDRLENIIKRTNAYQQEGQEEDPAENIPKMLGNPDSNILLVVKGDYVRGHDTMCEWCVKTIDLLNDLPYLNRDKVAIVDIEQEDPMLMMYMAKNKLGIPLIYFNNKYYSKGYKGLEKMFNCGELRSFIRDIGAHE